MKIYYTTSDILDENLDQKCPFGEKHRFKFENGNVYESVKKVGCGGCYSCKYCYGGRHNAKRNILIPNKYPNPKKEFTLIQERYIKCAKCFTDEYQKNV